MLIDWVRSGRTGKYLALSQDALSVERSEVCASWPRTKYFLGLCSCLRLLKNKGCPQLSLILYHTFTKTCTVLRTSTEQCLSLSGPVLEWSRLLTCTCNDPLWVCCCPTLIPILDRRHPWAHLILWEITWCLNIRHYDQNTSDPHIQAVIHQVMQHSGAPHKNWALCNSHKQTI